VSPIHLSAYRDFLETAPDAMLVIDGESLTRLANSQVQTLFGLDHGTLVGQTIEGLLPERLRQYHGPSHRQHLAHLIPVPEA